MSKKYYFYNMKGKNIDESYLSFIFYIVFFSNDVKVATKTHVKE